MRYYTIVISDASGKVQQLQGSTDPKSTYSSLVNGKFNPNALGIVIDISVAPFAQPMGTSYVQVWGIGLEDLVQAPRLNGMNIKIYAGMSAGLPLANPAQQGLITQGKIQQAFGNWQGTNMTLDMHIVTGNTSTATNIVQNWTAGTPLATVVDETLKASFPTYARDIKISPYLLLTHDEPGFFGNMLQYAAYLKRVSQSIIGGDTYLGIDVIFRENTITVYDGTTQGAPKGILFTDLVGQPVWNAPGIINLQCVMRGDLYVNDYILLPTKSVLVVTTQQSQSNYRNGSSIQGLFQINTVRHVGNFRQPDGTSWLTIFEARTVDAAP